MDIDRIITMASQGVRIQFLAFERSLRAVGCDLPLLVIPYDQEDGFDLPRNAEWWQKEEFTSWLKEHQTHPSMAKYVRLTEANYAYFDTDICFIEDCRTTLAQRAGFVVADTELIKYGEASTQESMEVLSRETSLWSLKSSIRCALHPTRRSIHWRTSSQPVRNIRPACFLPAMNNQELTS